MRIIFANAMIIIPIVAVVNIILSIGFKPPLPSVKVPVFGAGRLLFSSLSSSF